MNPAISKQNDVCLLQRVTMKTRKSSIFFLTSEPWKLTVKQVVKMETKIKKVEDKNSLPATSYLYSHLKVFLISLIPGSSSALAFHSHSSAFEPPGFHY
jgi:hypothetical protein